jgi:hypothetical protein
MRGMDDDEKAFGMWNTHKISPLPYQIAIKNDTKTYTFNTTQILTEALARWVLRSKTGCVSGVVSQQNGIQFTFLDGQLLL